MISLLVDGKEIGQLAQINGENIRAAIAPLVGNASAWQAEIELESNFKSGEARIDGALLLRFALEW